jgi:hypothetical protein
MSITDWTKYPNFDAQELACKHCGTEGVIDEMMAVLQSIRDSMESPIFLSSGYRCPKHPVEQDKDRPGEHTFGMAVDIICYGSRALRIIELAQALHVRRIGIHQKGNVNGRFVHLGIADKYKLDFPVAIWTY